MIVVLELFEKYDMKNFSTFLGLLFKTFPTFELFVKLTLPSLISTTMNLALMVRLSTKKSKSKLK